MSLFDETEEVRDNPEPMDAKERVQSLQDSFFENLRQTEKGKETAHRIASLPDDDISDKGKLFTGTKHEVAASTEDLLVSLYDVRDDLISTFEGSKLNTVVANSMTRNIQALGQCIIKLGGDASNFDPLDHISRLKAPDLKKNADRVIEITKQCYLGSIENINTQKDDANVILATFVGREGTVQYRAAATITAKHGWVGNEAIDYIYTPESGRLSVKAFSGGKWVDKSSTDDYLIYWDLEEGDEQDSVKKEAGKVDEKKEGVNQEIENNETDKESDFPIEEK